MVKNLFYIIILSGFISNAQVGIGTTNPQTELHIAGTTSTIRIEHLDDTNSPLYNNGADITQVFVDGNGDLTLTTGFGASSAEPLNFLIDIPNFIADDPYTLGYGSGTVVNSDATVATNEGQLSTVSFTVPQAATIEVKYGITLLVAGNDMSISVPTTYVTYEEAVTMFTYFCVDVNSDGLSVAEKAIKYGQKAQSYETNYGGSIGYPYMNGQGYLTLPPGTHELYFFGSVDDQTASYTSVGFGGDKDFLKIRVYN